jgi:predicted ester cyclase
MGVKENKALVSRWLSGGPPPEVLQAIHEGKDLKAFAEKTVRGIVEELFSPNVVAHLPGFDVNRETIIQGNVEIMSAFPDISFIIDKMVAEGDLVAVIGKSRATHLGRYQGIPATGKKIESGYMAMFRIAGGKIVEEWMYADASSLIQQLGVVPKQ